MSLYARSDLVHVIVSDAHGGCGKGHSRPVEHGAPAKVWELHCGPCSDHLRHDPQWSTTLTELPETPDETTARERDEKMGKLDRENQLAETLIELGKLGQLPQALMQTFGPILGALPGKTVCPSGHDNTAGSKFCAECGAAMHGAANAIEAPQAQAGAHHTPPGSEPEPGPAGKKVRLRDRKLEDLQEIARQRGLDDSGTRTDLLDRIREAA